MADKPESSLENGHHFWESEVELVRKKITAPDGKKFRYFDDKGIFNFVFFIWVYKWARATTERYLDPYSLHPLPLADQILRWQPILSRHISDGIARMEEWESLGEDEKGRAPKPVKFILWRAIWLTFWKRIVIILAGVLIINAIGMSSSIFLHKLLGLLSEGEFKVWTLIGLAVTIILTELVKEIGMDHLNYYVWRLGILLDACFRVVIFQHGLCYRRSQFGNLSSHPDACKSIIHSCSGDTLCAKDPLHCPARRYKNNEVTPKMYSLILNDSYYLPFFVEAVSGFIIFLTIFTYGLILITQQFNMKAMTILIVSLSLVLCMIIVEIVNGWLFKLFFGVRDHRISKSEEIVSALDIVEKMALDDVGHDIITETRDDELYFVLIRFFISLVNNILFTIIICVDIIILINDFVREVEDSKDVKDVDSSGLLASIFVIMKVIAPLYMVTIYLKFFMISLVSLLRLEAFFRTCSPNFYSPDNKFTGRVSLPEVLPDKDETVPKGLVVMFKKASFAWVNSRKDLLDKTGTTCLENIDFILNSGDLAIITGANGSGKTNFVKAILGDMTLVDGSMAVLPLSTNMPIFYASQDVWIQKGTIRSNITFGHKFNEDIYNTVIKAIELEHDISTWEEGDMRKITEHGYSLSGGQRVRVGLSRAIYAYLIYSKMNKEENDSKCSFLVVIDDSFTNLDPFVSKIIFKNLFNSKDGLLVKDDMATILTISKRILEDCTSSESSTSFPNAPIYTLKDKTLIHDNMLGTFMDHQVGHLESPRPSIDTVEHRAFSSEIRKLCDSDDCTRKGRNVLIQLAYSESPTAQHLYKNKTPDYKGNIITQFRVYFHAAGWSIFLFVVFTVIFSTLDNTKFIIASKVSDSIVDYANGQSTMASLEDVKGYCIKALKWVVILSASVMIGALVRITAMTKVSFNVSKIIHEYCIKSLFVNDSSVVKIKKSLGSILTFLSLDMLSIDVILSYCLHDASLLLIETVVQMLTLFFMIPWATPVAVILCLIITRFVLYYFFKSSKNVAFSRLEAFAQINTAIELGISGSHIHRSFKKEWELVHNLTEHVDYNTRSELLNDAVMFWTRIAFRCWLSPLALFLLLFPLMYSRCSDTDVQVGYYVMAYSVFLNLNSSFANFIRIYFYLQFCFAPMTRFQNFIPPNTPLVFGKKRNINRTDIVVDHSGSSGDVLSDDHIKSSIRTRRRKEFAERRAVGCSKIKMFFFKHKVNVLDVSEYAVRDQIRIKLDNVSAYITSKNAHEGYAILKNVTCSANVSDIIGIIGRTGAGKSTLLSVLQNLARYRDGSVLLDGCDLRDMPKAVTRQIIGVLPQLPFVFRGWTVRRFIDPRRFFEDIDIELALENCNLLKFVENLPGEKGLDTIILPEHYHKDLPTYLKRVYYGPTLKPYEASSVDNVNVDHGAALSNSQLRTLSAARLVLYREFYKVLLVDEPPEDELGENTPLNTVGTPIYELVRTYFRHCTTFIAAHDASVLRLCTSVWAFHDGLLVKTCRAEDIVDSNSLSKIIEDCISQHT